MRRPFTVLEIVVVLSLILILAGGTVWSLDHLLRYHRFCAQVESLKDLIEELQIEALALRSDLSIFIKKDRNGWKAWSKTDEPLLHQKIIVLKEVKNLTVCPLDSPASLAIDQQKELLITISSTGRITPVGVIGLEGGQQLWIDLREPLQINLSKKYPEPLSSTFLPKRPEKEKPYRSELKN